MTIMNILLLLAFCTPSLYSLVHYLRRSQPEEKPGKAAVAGILLCTAGAAAYLTTLMWNTYFY